MGADGKCLHEERWESFMKRVDEQGKKIDEIHGRLFVGNGTPALWHLVKVHDRILMWALGVVSVAAGSGIVWMVSVWFRSTFTMRGG
jgi:hypothetical protein